MSARRPQVQPPALRPRPPHPPSRLRPRPAHGGARRVPMPQHGMLPNCPQAQQPRPRLENACRSQRAGCGAALYLVNSLTIAAPLLQVLRGWVFCRRACLQSCRAGHLCHHASETLALPAHATQGTRASRPPSQPREKKPTPLRNLTEGGNINSARAIGIIYLCPKTRRSQRQRRKHPQRAASTPTPNANYSDNSNSQRRTKLPWKATTTPCNNNSSQKSSPPARNLRRCRKCLRA